MIYRDEIIHHKWDGDTSQFHSVLTISVQQAEGPKGTQTAEMQVRLDLKAPDF